MVKRPEWDGDDLRGRLRQYDRAPFLDVLHHFMQNAPTDEAVRKLAERSPEKFVAAMTQLARIAGFSEKTEATVDINVHISQMSDSQLEDYIKTNMKVIDALPMPEGHGVHGTSTQLAQSAPAALADMREVSVPNGRQGVSQTGTQQEHTSTEDVIRAIFKREAD